MSNPIKQGFRRLLVKHNIKRTRSFEISAPTEFKHVYHVGADQAFGNIDLVRFNFDNLKPTTSSSSSISEVKKASLIKSKTNAKKLKRHLSTSLPDISKPYNFKHNIHVIYDRLEQKFYGLPEGWEEQVHRF